MAIFVVSGRDDGTTVDIIVLSFLGACCRLRVLVAGVCHPLF